MILIQIIIISFLVFAIHYAFLPGEIFAFVDKRWQKKINYILNKADRYDEEIKTIKRGESEHGQLPVCLGKRMIWLRKQYKRLLNDVVILEKLKEPLFACPVCMAPWHGTYLYYLIPWQRIGLPTHDWVAWLVIIISCLGLNSIVIRTFKADDE